MKSTISPEYAELNRRMHEEHPGYGRQAAQDAEIVVSNAEQNGFKTILDFGCGKGALKPAVEAKNPALTVLEYDPAIPGKDALPPGPVDFLVALDVLEHVEPNYLMAVLERFSTYHPKMIMLKIASKPSRRTLPDGRNAHVLLRGAKWWQKHLGAYFKEVGSQAFTEHLIYFGVPAR